MPTQKMIVPPARSGQFLVMTVHEGKEAQVLEILTVLSGTVRAVAFRVPDAELDCVTGIGSDLWDRMLAAPRPAGLHPLPVFAGDVHTSVTTPGDLLFHLRATRQDVTFELCRQLISKFEGLATVVDQTQGFSYFDERDLLGFVDGTENPEGPVAQASVLVGQEDPVHRGGSYIVVQKYLHDLTGWNDLSVREQEDIIGRTKLDDIEQSAEIQSPRAHIELNTVLDDDGRERQIVRDNMPFGDPGSGEYGTYFIGYARDSIVTETMLQNMFVGRPPGQYDRILDFSTPITGGLFFAPALELFDNLQILASPPRGEHGDAGAVEAFGAPQHGLHAPPTD